MNHVSFKSRSWKHSLRGAQLNRCSEIYGQSLKSTCEGVGLAPQLKINSFTDIFQSF